MMHGNILSKLLYTAVMIAPWSYARLQGCARVCSLNVYGVFMKPATFSNVQLWYPDCGTTYRGRVSTFAVEARPAPAADEATTVRTSKSCQAKWKAVRPMIYATSAFLLSYTRR